MVLFEKDCTNLQVYPLRSCFPQYFSWAFHYMSCNVWRPTAGLPPDVLPLSGVLFSQSLMRPATPVFITAASCLKKKKKRKRGPKVSSAWTSSAAGATQEVPASPASSFLSFPTVALHNALVHRHVSYLEGAPATSRWVEHVALLPHALDVPYAVGDHGQVHRSGARGSRLLVLSLQTPKCSIQTRKKVNPLYPHL